MNSPELKAFIREKSNWNLRPVVFWETLQGIAKLFWWHWPFWTNRISRSNCLRRWNKKIPDW